MTAPESTPPMSYWQPPSTQPSEFPGLSQLRARLVALVAALVIQATIAACDVLPRLPGTHSTVFWAQFALVEFLAAVVVSLAFGPGIRLSDLPAVARAVLGIGFVLVPAAAIGLGGVDTVHSAAAHGAAAAGSSALVIAFFGVIFFGLPAIALGGRVRTGRIGLAT